MKATSLAFRFAPAAIVMMFLAASGCAQKKVADQPGAKKNSQVQVIAPSTNDESWMIRTSTAQFEFTKDGSLHASLLKDGKSLSIDSPLTTADEIQINGKAVTDF